jgi:hypothetical protein
MGKPVGEITIQPHSWQYVYGALACFPRLDALGDEGLGYDLGDPPTGIE